MAQVMMIRPRQVNLVIGLFGLGMGLHIFEVFRYQYVVSPDYFNLFWMIYVPIFLAFLAAGFLALYGGARVSSMVAPLILILAVIIRSDGATEATRPPGWPTPLPTFVYVLIVIGLIALLISPPSAKWYSRRHDAGCE